MSLRDWLRRRARQGWLIQLSAFAACALAMWLLPDDWRPGSIFTLAMVFLSAFALAQSRIACTRCGNALGTVVPPWRLHCGSPAKRIHHCPFCGTRLDEPARPPGHS